MTPELIRRRNFLKFATLAGISTTGLSAAQANDSSGQNKKPVDFPVLLGESREVITAHPEKPGEIGWFTNDHCFIEDRNGRLHWIGINNPFPPSGKKLYRYHPYLGHYSTTDPLGKWQKHPWALDESNGTEYLGAPAVIWHENQQRYVMVVETRLDTRRLEVCYSDDLTSWKRTRKAILPEKLWISTRDPQIIARPDGSYWIIITSFDTHNRKESQIIRLITKDFITFQGPEVIMAIQDYRSWGTLIESPFLWEHNGLWYLFFTYAHRRYCETPVVVSGSPDNFDFQKNCITTLFGHAAEIFTYQGKTYISSCGPEDKHATNKHGVTLAELGWARLA